MITRSELKRFASLSLKKRRDELGLFLVEGARAVAEASRSEAPLEVVVHSKAFEESPAGSALLAALSHRAVRLEPVTERDLAALSDTVHAQGVVGVVRCAAPVPWELLRGEPVESLVVGLDAVGDPGNLGAIIRTCDWFGVDGVLVGRDCVDLYNPKAVRATMGSLFHLRIAEGVDLQQAAPRARELGYAVAVADAAGENPPGAASGGKLLVVFGNEARGVTAELRHGADLRLAIPRYGSAESLNVAVACGVILAAIRGRAPC